MTSTPEHQLGTLDDAYDLVARLGEKVKDARHEIEAQVKRNSVSSHRLDSLRLALRDLNKIELHMNQTGRILDELLTLRQLL
jgi:hypothetical protein